MPAISFRRSILYFKFYLMLLLSMCQQRFLPTPCYSFAFHSQSSVTKINTLLIEECTGKWEPEYTLWELTHSNTWFLFHRKLGEAGSREGDFHQGSSRCDVTSMTTFTVIPILDQRFPPCCSTFSIHSDLTGSRLIHNRRRTSPNDLFLASCINYSV